ncbi:cysteine desulfurase [Vagococcus lutrae]|uniref:cysteine desulfurase n=1 Tax=Vagococcus lutrae TaxID=81947 RepID=UPI0019266AFC|nr:cysteine desulfurase [Vagococcus lutrae]GEQ62040.1 cysteine desulfurase [Vagococcus lutrae]GEQ63987.1 cysteine desulfurase [Vagococcus lutrae]GEQ65864.1 cysteine desulfurase [Vagococcus lutrae]
MMLGDKRRNDFPILHQTVNDEPLVYLDNAATTQKPRQVLEAMSYYDEHDHANVHRGVHTLGARATEAYEAARENVRQFIHAHSTKEVLFTRGTTTSLNWVAQSYGDVAVKAGDDILLSYAEHHANLVPWQQLAKRKQANLVYIDLDEEGRLDMTDFQTKLSSKTKIVALAHVTNVLGTIQPIKEIARLTHEVGGVIVVDGAQSVPHIAVDVQDLDVDFYAFSGHKMYGPTGIGVLYGKEKWLEQMSPVEFGGEMIEFVHLYDSTWADLPWKFEAGTPNMTGAIGLSAAIDYLTTIGMTTVMQHEQALMADVLPRLQAIEGVTVFGPTSPSEHAGVIAFNIDGIHPHDVATAMDMQGVAVRAGHHCAQPLMKWLDVHATNRASLGLYTTQADLDQFIQAVIATKEFFQNGTI